VITRPAARLRAALASGLPAFLVVLLLAIAPGAAWARTLVPMDGTQTDHLRAYGLMYWALARGGTERNPVLALGHADVGMVKMLQFPLIAKAVDMIEARDPRLGRRLRWVTLAFHALLAFNNVRLGAASAQRGRITRASGTP
jgi:hypothetical protein